MTTQSDSQASEGVLERIRAELERISVSQHELARRKALLRDLATQVRCGRSSTLSALLRETTASSVIDALDRSYRRGGAVEDSARTVTRAGRDHVWEGTSPPGR